MKDSSHGHDSAGPYPENSASPRKEMSEKEKFEFMRDLILARRGYLVIGVHFPGTCVVGQPIHKIWNKEREGSFRVTKKTTKRDWNEQLKLAKQQGKFAVNPSEIFKDTEYFRVVRDDHKQSS